MSEHDASEIEVLPLVVPAEVLAAAAARCRWIEAGNPVETISPEDFFARHGVPT